MRNMLSHREFEICTITLKLHCYTLICMSRHVVVFIWYIVHRMHPQIFIILWTKWHFLTSPFIAYIPPLYDGMDFSKQPMRLKYLLSVSLWTLVFYYKRNERDGQSVFVINASSTWGSAWLNSVNLDMPHFPRVVYMT